MSQRFKNQVVLVTGGSKGIGRGIVKVFVINEALVKFGQIDCLVNNVGRHPPDEKIDDVTAKELQELFNANVVSYFLFSKYALPSIRKVKGSIINVSGLAGTVGQPNSVTYVTTKGAIVSMTKAMAIDEVEHGVRVNCICPGNIWTSMWQLEASRTADPESYIKNGAAQQLSGRFGSSEEIGKLALYIAADASFTTGVEFFSTGGAELTYGKKSRVPVQLPSACI